MYGALEIYSWNVSFVKTYSYCYKIWHIMVSHIQKTVRETRDY